MKARCSGRCKSELRWNDHRVGCGGTANLNLDGMYGQDDSRPTSAGIAANRKCGEGNAAGK